MIKDTKIQQYTEYIEKAGKVLQRAELLYSALQGYTPKTINKRFFELFFTVKDEAGQVSKDWKGNIRTDFYFTDKAYDWDKYAKRIYLSNSEYIECMSTSIVDVCKATGEKIAIIKAQIANYKGALEIMKMIDEGAIIKDLLAIYEKYGKPATWGEILSSYDVKYPN